MKLSFKKFRDRKFYYLLSKHYSQLLVDLKSMGIDELLRGRENVN